MSTLKPTERNNNPRYLCPQFRAMVEAGLKLCHEDGYRLFIFEGFRSPQRQNYLYEQGRTREGNKITWKKAWGSWHQYGLAVDIVYKHDGKRWSWDGDYHKPSIFFKAQGLEWLGDKGVELVHYQLTGGLTTAEAKAITDQHGLQTLWMEVFERAKNRFQAV